MMSSLAKYWCEFRHAVAPENIDIQAGGAVPFDGIGVIALPFKYPALLPEAALHRGGAHHPNSGKKIGACQGSGKTFAIGWAPSNTAVRIRRSVSAFV